jgi:predicted GIY-YIG superfamily endonuclease
MILAPDMVLKCGLMKGWVVYLVKCSNGAFYCGVTNDIKKRVSLHNKGKASKYTRARLPVKLSAVSRPLTKVQAMKNEYRIKRLPKGEKRLAVKSI